MGLLSLMKSGETTRAGRSPACSEPTTGSRRTRTMSPRRRLFFEDTMDFLLERVIFLFDFQVDLGHGFAAFFNIVAQFHAALPVDPIAQQGGNQGAPFAGRDNVLEGSNRAGRQ